MPTRNIVLTDHQSQVVENLVATGRYQNASEVLREGLRLVEVREAENFTRLAALQAQVQVGITDLDAGRFSSFESADSLQSYLDELKSKAIAAS